MSDKKYVDMDTPRTFNSPSDGSSGAVVRMPEVIRKIALGLDGETMPLREAVALLRAADIGEVWVVSEYDYIGLLIRHHGSRHHFRVISYK